MSMIDKDHWDHLNDAAENLAIALDYPNGYMHLGTSDLIALAQVQATIALTKAVIVNGRPF